jgi:hypothetical protein
MKNFPLHLKYEKYILFYSWERLGLAVKYDKINYKTLTRKAIILIFYKKELISCNNIRVGSILVEHWTHSFKVKGSKPTSG